jgi:hypothetical protein
MTNNIIIPRAKINELLNFGFEQSKVALYPIKLVRVVDWDNKLILVICNDEPVINMWDGKDKNSVGIPILWTCTVLEKRPNGSLYYECTSGIYNKDIVSKYMQDIPAELLTEKEI